MKKFSSITVLLLILPVTSWQYEESIPSYNQQKIRDTIIGTSRHLNSCTTPQGNITRHEPVMNDAIV